MTILDILKGYKQRFGSNDIVDVYSMLKFAMDLPGICGRLEFPFLNDKYKFLYYKNGRPLDKDMFKYWIKNHIDVFRILFSTSKLSDDDIAVVLYDLRCELVHCGCIKDCFDVESGQQKFYFYFVNCDCLKNMGFSIGHSVFIFINSFCNYLFDEAYRVFVYNNVLVTNFSNVGLSVRTYDSLSQYLNDRMFLFWSRYTRREKVLYDVYSYLVKNGIFEDVLGWYRESYTCSYIVYDIKDYLYEVPCFREFVCDLFWFLYFDGHGILNCIINFEDFNRMCCIAKDMEIWLVRLDSFCFEHYGVHIF